jgi:hypothetical protein
MTVSEFLHAAGALSSEEMRTKIDLARALISLEGFAESRRADQDSPQAAAKAPPPAR